MGRIHQYEGESIEVSYDARRCIHAAECVRGLPGVFDPSARPWVSPDGATADEIAGVIERCPTGALYYRRKDGHPNEAAPPESTVRLVMDGPLYVTGSLHLSDPADRTSGEATRVALCRCGASKNKPFCDNSHREVGFTG